MVTRAVDQRLSPGLVRPFAVPYSTRVAITYRTLPVPAFDEYTTRIPAGAVTFGVEYRHLDEAVILDYYGPDARSQFDDVTPAGMEGSGVFVPEEIALALAENELVHNYELGGAGRMTAPTEAALAAYDARQTRIGALAKVAMEADPKLPPEQARNDSELLVMWLDAYMRSTRFVQVFVGSDDEIPCRFQPEPAGGQG